MTKFDLVRAELLKLSINPASLLDVGCRGCELKRYVDDIVEYRGVDLFQNPEGTVDYVQDVESGLTVSTESFDYVVALDLVEHLNDFKGGLEELLRVTKHTLMIMLPNAAYFTLRKEFFLHGSFSRLTDKYDLRYNMGLDRHRWLTVLPQTDEYMKNFAKDNNLDLNIIWFNDSRKKLLFQKLGTIFRLSPSWWVWSSFYILHKQ